MATSNGSSAKAISAAECHPGLGFQKLNVGN
jgi:hypothetical protein